MKIIHSSDWHLGQTFFQHERTQEHLLFFTWLQQLLVEEACDVLLLAGDIFDGPNPSALSQRLFFDFIRDTTRSLPNLQIIITSGNHDSGARLEAPNPLLESMGVIVRGIVHRKEEEIDYDSMIVPLKDKQGVRRAWCLAVPYLRSGDYPSVEIHEGEDKHAAGIKALYTKLMELARRKATNGEAIVAMGHLQTFGAEIADDDKSHRAIVGGLEHIAVDTFHTDLVYTALGHIHKAQRVSSRENLRYAGSPLPMSFAEINYNHGVTLLEIEKGVLTQNEHRSFEAPVKLISVPNVAMELAEVLVELDKLPSGPIETRSPYLEVKVKQSGAQPNLRYDIEQILKEKAVKLCRIKLHEDKKECSEKQALSVEEIKQISPLELAQIIYTNKYGEAMPNELLRLMEEVTNNPVN